MLPRQQAEPMEGTEMTTIRQIDLDNATYAVRSQIYVCEACTWISRDELLICDLHVTQIPTDVEAELSALIGGNPWRTDTRDQDQRDHEAVCCGSATIRVHGHSIIGYAVHHKNGDVGLVSDQVPQWHGGSHLVKVNGVKVSVPTMSVLMTSASTGLTRWVATHNLTVE
jgi:hypothetical protein